MSLRVIIENMKHVNLMIGRFQPFTTGHYKCVEEAMKQKGLPTVVAMINTTMEKVDEKHPFPSSLTLPLYNDLFKKDKNLEKFILVSNADIVKISEAFAKEGYQIASWTCGTDRIDSYTRMSEKYHDQANLADDFEMIEIFRTGDDVSATKVRKALIDGDKKAFYSMVPMVHLSARLKNDYYEVLKEQIDKVVK